MSSRIWIVLSNWSSVYGWCVVQRSNFVPGDFCKLIWNWDVNLGSLTDRILVGTLCNFTTSLMYTLVSFAREKSILIGMKCVDLVKRSTMTQMTSFLLNVVCNPVTKSMVIFSHFYSHTSNVCIRPEGIWCSAFTSWHIMHLATKVAVSSFMPFHQYCLFIS